MISVSVPILDIHIILLDPMLILSGMVIIFLQGISLKVSKPTEAPEMPSAFTQGFVIVPVHCALITLQLFIEFYIFAFAISMSKKSHELFSHSPQLSTHSMNLCHTLVLMTSLTSEVHSLLLLDSQVFSLHVYMVSQKSLFCTLNTWVLILKLKCLNLFKTDGRQEGKKEGRMVFWYVQLTRLSYWDRRGQQTLYSKHTPSPSYSTKY